MALCVIQAQVAHRSLLGPSRLDADWVSEVSAPCPAAGETCCKTDMRAYLVNKDNEMKRINALSGMKWRVLLLVFLAGYTADVAIADHEIDESDFLCAASDGPESMRVERVLTAGQIDSSTVDVGALAVVVYGQEERHPISGAWTQLDTVIGSIKAVDSRRLIVGLEPDGWSKWIALERIQTLSLIGAPLSAADRDPTRTSPTKRTQPAQADPEVARSDSLSEQKALRIGKKLAAGVGGGLVGALTGGIIAVSSLGAPPEAEPGTDPSSGDALGSLFATILGSCIGNMVGAAIGVSLVDPQDNSRITFGHSLAGSVVGLLGGIGLTAASKGTLWPSLFVGPVAMATAWSERLRKPPEFSRVSFGLAPTFNGGLSAFAQLRF